MNEYENNLSATYRPKALRLQKLEVKQLQVQYEDLKSRLGSLKDLLTDKESLIKSQRTTLKIQEEKISQLSMNNDLLRHMVHILSKHITEALKESLPALPQMPKDNLNELDSILAATNKEKKSRRRIKSGTDVLESYMNRPQAEKAGKAQQKCFDFAGSEVLSAISELQDIRRAAQQAARAQGRYTIITSYRISLFEALSLFLSLRNVAFLNNFEVFLPRVLEMVSDLLELERIIVYVYDEGQLYSLAQIGDINKQMVIPKGFSHLYSGLSTPVVFPSAYEDAKFDVRYDQITGFKTNNLACVPLMIGESTVGILECSNKKTDFIKEDIVLLCQIAKQLALGVAGKLYSDNFKDLGGESVSKNLNLALPALKSLVLSIKSFVLCEKVSIFIPDSNKLFCLVASDSSSGSSVPVNVSLVGLCFTSKKIINLPNAHDHSLYDKKLESYKEVLLIPLGDQGVIQCINKTKGFNERDEAKVANQATIAQHLLQMTQKIEKFVMNCEISENFCDCVSEVLICADYEGKILFINKKGCELLQVSKDTCIGMPVTQALEQTPDLLGYVVKNRTSGVYPVPKTKVRGQFICGEISYMAHYFILTLNIS